MKHTHTDLDNIVIIDCEVYPNYFLICVQKMTDGKTISVEIKGGSSRFTIEERRELHNLLRRYTSIGFNSLHYDLPIVTYAIDGATCNQIYRMSQRVIKTRSRDWQTYRQYEVNPLNLSHIDLFEPSPSVMVGLKLYAGRLHTPTLRSLPIAPESVLTADQIRLIKNYCLNDLVMTADLYNAIKDRIELRLKMSKGYGLNLMGKSDAQIAEAIIKAKLDIENVKNEIPETVTYTAPDYIKFTTPELQNVLTLLDSHQFDVNDSGNIKLPSEITKLKIVIGNTTYKLGIGGLHSKEKAMTVIPNNSQLLLDRDVTAYYPSLILNLRLYPEKLGHMFLDEYELIVNERVEAKRSGDATVNASLKIVINGLFGKFGNQYSAVYSPKLLLAVTLTGQLSLLMLIEQLEANGISVVSANTDGVVSLLAQSDRELFNSICERWEAATKLSLDETKYKALYSKDVNNYFALTVDGDEKRKGVFANTGLNKNPANSICIEAAVKFIKTNTSITSTINRCADIRQFLRVQRVNGGATWKGEPIGNVVRFYYSTKGEHITRVSNGGKVPFSTDSVPVIELPDNIPDDLDYSRYIEESEKLLKNVGFDNKVA